MFGFSHHSHLNPNLIINSEMVGGIDLRNCTHTLHREGSGYLGIRGGGGGGGQKKYISGGGRGAEVLISLASCNRDYTETR